MNIKKGDVLKGKHSGFPYKVLGIVDGVYIMSAAIEYRYGGNFFTLEGLKETFELPEEKSDEIVRIAYGDENISINKGNQHIVLSKKDLNFILQSIVKNCEINVETLQA